MIFLTIILISVPIILVLALFISTRFKFEKDISIDRPLSEVFNYFKQLRNQEYFNSWLIADKKLEKDFRGEDGKVGSVFAWHSKSKKIGRGHQEIVEMIEPTKIGVVIRLEKPIESRAFYSLKFEQETDSRTRVTCQYKSNISPYYFLRVIHMLLRLKKAASIRVQSSLENAKDILEKH